MEPQSPPNPAHFVDESPTKGGWKLKVTEIIDIVVKLVPVFATVIIAVIANNFQAAMSTSNLLSQREQADSTLRADMFQGLIEPILKSQKESESIPIDREQLMVELLALNFHESFELKPMMLHVENRLVQEQHSGVDHTGQTPRESLRSIANRVLQRQLAAITKVEGDPLAGQRACIYQIEWESTLTTAGDAENPSAQPCSTIKSTYNDFKEVKSPNGAYTLHFQIWLPKGKTLEDQVFRVQIVVKDNTSKQVTTNYDFLLTRFDFPFTDNTLLADGTRFSLVIDRVKVDTENKPVGAVFKLVWFPQDYFSARERPTNYRQFREKLGINLE